MMWEQASQAATEPPVPLPPPSCCFINRDLGHPPSLEPGDHRPVPTIPFMPLTWGRCGSRLDFRGYHVTSYFAGRALWPTWPVTVLLHPMTGLSRMLLQSAVNVAMFVSVSVWEASKSVDVLPSLGWVGAAPGVVTTLRALLTGHTLLCTTGLQTSVKRLSEEVVELKQHLERYDQIQELTRMLQESHRSGTLWKRCPNLGTCRVDHMMWMV